MEKIDSGVTPKQPSIQGSFSDAASAVIQMSDFADNNKCERISDVSTKPVPPSSSNTLPNALDHIGDGRVSTARKILAWCAGILAGAVVSAVVTFLIDLVAIPLLVTCPPAGAALAIFGVVAGGVAGGWVVEKVYHKIITW